MPQNWGEFKAYLEAHGVKDEDEINYIDWSGHGGPPNIEWDYDFHPRGVAVPHRQLRAWG